MQIEICLRKLLEAPSGGSAALACSITAGRASSHAHGARARRGDGILARHAGHGCADGLRSAAVETAVEPAVETAVETAVKTVETVAVAKRAMGLFGGTADLLFLAAARIYDPRS